MSRLNSMSSRHRNQRLSLCLLLPLLLGFSSVRAATDLATVPVETLTTGAARTNLMFILDDSSSMSYEYMPDDRGADKVCFGYYGYNKIFFNPNIKYDPPATGLPDISTTAVDESRYPNADWPSPYNDGYAKSGTKTTLNAVAGGPFVKGSQRFYYTVWNKAPAAASTCEPAEYAQYTLVKTLTVDQQQNYANWFSYYRTRMAVMRAGVGKAFADPGQVDPTKLRLGFSTISDKGATDGAMFLNVRDMEKVPAGQTKTQKALFYDRLYSAATFLPDGDYNFTPLRPALVKAGRYFANKVAGQTDPMQYSCQRNYTILSTDGYWNLHYAYPYPPGGVTKGGNETLNYVPPQVDGVTAIGNQDGGTTPRPYYEGPTAVSNSLADIAMYYYKTDLRSSLFNNCTGVLGTDVCTDNIAVNPDARDNAKYQHMTTFTIGLGVNGVLTYDSNYEAATSGDYFNIKTGGGKDWPNPNVTNTAVDGAALIPRVDDLWHAAVNGRGYYYSAGNADELANNLSAALASLVTATGSSAAAATSSLKPIAGDDKIFIVNYRTNPWEGELSSFTVNTTNGTIVNPAAPNWKAGDLLKNRDLATAPRKIYFFNESAQSKLAAFAYDNLSDTQKGYFNNLCTAPAKLGQCSTLGAAALAKITGSNVVSYLAGDRSKEESASAVDDRVFRKRLTPLGDIVNASPVYVKKPPFKYRDAGYAAFVASKAARKGVVYAGANDGMLHAFDATSGQELWAYVPSMVMPEMYRLADVEYGEGYNHRFYVDATPVVADVYDRVNNSWRTILVGGLNSGGRGYYALDITDPDSPKGLWEFTNIRLGFSFGNPIVTKMKNGTWVVLFTSGYDNNPGAQGDGNGRLFWVDAMTGVMVGNVQTYLTGTTRAGTMAEPNNLSKINAWVEDEADNTAKRVYGGDMLGNLWRFDFDDNIAPAGNEAFLLGQVRTGDGTPKIQPISIRPQLTEIKVGTNKYALVSFATGRYVGQSDLSDTTLQSVYVVKDDLSTNSLGVLRTNTRMVEQTMTAAHTIGTLQTVDWATKAGWFVDLDALGTSSGERVTVDMQQQFTTLTVAANIPKASACEPGGTGQLYYFDIASGNILQSQTFSTTIAGITTVLVNTENGGPGTATTEVVGGDGKITSVNDPNQPTGTTLAPRRTSWRELVD